MHLMSDLNSRIPAKRKPRLGNPARIRGMSWQAFAKLSGATHDDEEVYIVLQKVTVAQLDAALAAETKFLNVWRPCGTVNEVRPGMRTMDIEMFNWLTGNDGDATNMAITMQIMAKRSVFDGIRERTVLQIWLPRRAK